MFEIEAKQPEHPNITQEIEKMLWEQRDESYQHFYAGLVPGLDPDNMIGVRTPILRKMAKSLSQNREIDLFLHDLPHRYYEENNLHSFIIAEIRDFSRAVAEVDALLPYVDNWATCDQLLPKAFRKNRDKLPENVDRWLKSERTYTRRFGIGMVMTHFLDDDFRSDYLARIAAIRSDEYYINMMLAWFFATALAKQWDATIDYLLSRRLTPWVHNKTIRKAIESYRITAEQKAFLRTLKIENIKKRDL